MSRAKAELHEDSACKRRSKLRGTSSDIFGLNPKTKWKLLISLALILLSCCRSYACRTIEHHTMRCGAAMGVSERAFAFALIRTYINCAWCMCMFIFVQFLEL